jgi:type II secretory pathway component PulJ
VNRPVPPDRRTRWRQDDGITLVELMVAMALTSLVLIATLMLLGGIQRTDQATWGRTDDTTAAQYAFRVAERDLAYALLPSRFGDVFSTPVLSASAESVTVLVREERTASAVGEVADGTLVVVQLAVDGGVLTETRAPADALADGAALSAVLPVSDHCGAELDCTSRVLVDGAEDGTGFAYLDASGAAIPLTGSTAGDPRKARSIELTLLVRTDPDRQAVASTHRQRIYLKNA